MATRYWILTTGSGSWNDTANWSATNGGAGGASVPVTGDTVYIIQGNSNINSGLDQSLVAPLNYLYVAFNGTIGTSSQSLKFGGVNCHITSGSPTVYIACTNVTSCFVWTYEGSNPTVTVTEAGTAEVYISAGICTVGASCLSFVFENGGGTIVLSSGSANVAGASHFALAGTTIINRPLSHASDVLSCNGGTCIYAGAGTVTSVTVWGQATYIHNSSGTITLIVVEPYGIASSSGASSPFTVTQSTLWGYGALFQNSPVAITYTNPTAKYNTNRSN